MPAVNCWACGLLLLLLLACAFECAALGGCTPAPGKLVCVTVDCTPASYTYEGARAKCASVGARLCYADDIADAGPGTPSCSPVTLANQISWTMDMCNAATNIGPRQRYYATAQATPAKTCANADTAITIRLRCCNQAAPAYSGSKKNILWIIVDDLRPDLNVSYGRDRSTTPYLDKFALDPKTLVFERAYADYPKCSPSRMSFLTGLSPLTTGLDAAAWLTTPDPSTHRVLPEFFRDNGYVAYTGGKVFHEGHNNNANNQDINRFWNGSYEINQDQDGYGALCTNTNVYNKFNAAITNADANKKMCHTTAGQANLIDFPLTDKAHAQLRALAAVNSSFLLAVGFFKPHANWKVHRKYVWQTSSTPAFNTPSWNAVSPGATGIPDFFDDIEDGVREIFLTATQKAWIVMPWNAGKQTILQTMHQAYRACVAQTDEKIGGLLERLEALNLANNTVVLIMGDNGFTIGELGLFSKYKLFELANRVPFMVRVPDVTPWRSTPTTTVLRARKQIQLLDVYRTLAGLVDLGLNVSTLVQGEDRSQYIRQMLQQANYEANDLASDMSFAMVRRCGDAAGVQVNCAEVPVAAAPMKWIGLSLRTPLWRYNIWLDAPNENVAWPASRADLSLSRQELYNHSNDASNLLNYSGGATFHDVELSNQVDWCTTNAIACDGFFDAIKNHFQMVRTRSPTPASG